MSNLPEIIELPVELTNLIAAGEVVERPASVVKELIENALDASATKIKIELVSCGIKKITITDNGVGMTKDQIPLAVKAHATSKLKSKDDLFNITTLGFRGEALASICSISHMKITSSTNSLDGYVFEYSANQLISSKPAAMAKGTMIEVADLFFNTPARYKNLGSEPLELSHITTIIQRIAFANPDISFTLINDGKLLYKTMGDGDVISITGETYGVEVAKNTFEFSGENNLYKIHGFTTTNNVFRSNKNYINIIINNRVIRNQSMLYGVTDAYQSIIPVGKYPITTLFIECDAKLIDVNVHPSKLEIRFTDEYGLKSLICSTILKALHNISLVYNATEDDVDEQAYTPFVFETETPKEESKLKEEKVEVVEPKQSIDDLWQMFADDEQDENDEDSDDDEIDEESIILEETDESDNYGKIPVQEELKFEKKKFSSLRYIGQYHKTYLLFEDDDDLYLIDQHAAMERCRYEKIYKSLCNKDNAHYELIVPIKIDFAISDIPMILSKENEFLELGLKIESFGGASILIREVPVWVPHGLEVEYISDMINNIIHDRSASKSVMFNSLAKQMACKSSIKANMNILEVEVESLLAGLDECEMPYTCPHGRPTLVKISTYELEKMFKRVI